MLLSTFRMALPTFSNSIKKTLHRHSIGKPNLDHFSFRLSSQVIKGCKKTITATHHTGTWEPKPLLLSVHILATMRRAGFLPHAFTTIFITSHGVTGPSDCRVCDQQPKHSFLGAADSQVFFHSEGKHINRVLLPFLIGGVGLSIKGHTRPYNICLQPWWEEPQPLRFFFLFFHL